LYPERAVHKHAATEFPKLGITVPVAPSDDTLQRNGEKRMAINIVPAVPPERTIDIAFENHGSIVLIRGWSGAGQAWLDENVGNDETQDFGNAIAAEPRYCSAIILGAQHEGLAVCA
jgi:hypothetical protein